MKTQRQSKLTVASLAERLGGVISGRADLAIEGVNTLDDAGPDEATFIADAAHARLWARSRAAAAVVTRGLAVDGHDERARAIITVPNAELAMITLLELFQPPESIPDIGAHASAVIDESSRVGRDVRIGPHVSVGARAIIGDRCVLHAGARLYADVSIGPDCVIHSNVVIRERSTLGSRVILHQGVSIGADGFGYRPRADGSGLLKVPQIGGVRIEDDVEIGANSCIDRGKFGETVIGAGTKIDNLVQIAHNCRIGRSCIIAGMAGLAGSVTLGDGVQVGGSAGFSDHVRVGDGARIGARSGVHRDVPAGETWLGLPAEPAEIALRQVAAVRKLPDLIKRLRRVLEVESR
jgi:UDP-3-O-[3-hydroxymyristoyl] glucosamine N-acyltransferase